MPTIAEKVAAVHRAVEALAQKKAVIHKDRMQCKRGCHACCIDGLTVFEVEAERILAEFANVDLGLPSSSGCVFLGDEGECRIYEARPYVCRTQGLPLRWFDDEGAEPIEFRDICELNIEGPALEDLDPESCWTIGHVESILQALQLEHSGELRRVSLRDLFGEISGD